MSKLVSGDKVWVGLRDDSCMAGWVTFDGVGFGNSDYYAPIDHLARLLRFRLYHEPLNFHCMAEQAFCEGLLEWPL